jgi:hypothetical protein
MLKKTESSQNLGRPEVVSTEELLDRYKALKQFAENNWGRIGLELQRVRQPEDVRTALRLVPGVEWCRPFRDQPALCLLEDGTTEVEKRELDLTRQLYQDAADTEARLWSEYHSASQESEGAKTALKAVISQFEPVLGFYQFFFVIFVIAKKLEVEKLTNDTNRTKEALTLAQQKKQLLKNKLTSQNAWFARNEVVKFRNNTRFAKTPMNFAKAMAGLPHYGWLHSFRRCSMIPDESPSATSYLLFEILKKIVNKVKTINLRKIEKRLRDELLRQETDIFVRGHAAPNWVYMKQAFAECRGKGFKRAELAHKIMGRFLHHLERPKTITELELAKHEQLV